MRSVILMYSLNVQSQIRVSREGLLASFVLTHKPPVVQVMRLDVTVQAAVCAVRLVAARILARERLVIILSKQHIGSTDMSPHVLLQVLSIVERLLAVFKGADVIFTAVGVVRVHMRGHVALPREFPRGHSARWNILVAARIRTLVRLLGRTLAFTLHSRGRSKLRRDRRLEHLMLSDNLQ